jgi:hypothetical protein
LFNWVSLKNTFRKHLPDNSSEAMIEDLTPRTLPHKAFLQLGQSEWYYSHEC